MKHAGAATLAALGDVLARLRCLEGLREKTPGAFYLLSQAFLHFHEDPAGLFADLRVGSDWERLPVNTRGQRRQLLARVAELTKR